MLLPQSVSYSRAAGTVLVALLAASLLSRIRLSPLVILLLTPVALLTALLCWLAFNIVLALAVERYARAADSDETDGGAPRSRAKMGFATPAAWAVVQLRAEWESSKPSPDLPTLHPSSPEVSSALQRIISLITLHFVRAWFDKLSPSPSFPSAVERTIHGSLARVLARAADLDLATLAVQTILPVLTTHIDSFRKAEIALRGQQLERHLTESEELDLFLAHQYAAGGGKLHKAVNLSAPNSRPSEEAHLRDKIGRALEFIMPEKEFSSRAVAVMTREIVACAVMLPVIDMLSDPDFYNRLIDQQAGAAIREQKLVAKLRAALDSQSGQPPPAFPHISTHPSATPSTASSSYPHATTTTSGARVPRVQRRTEEISSRTTAKAFESFLRSIARCDSLLDARRIKNDITTQIRKTRVLLANHENETVINGEKIEDLLGYIDRLYEAKRKAEKRIAKLGGAGDSARQSIAFDPSREGSSSGGLELRDILTNPSSLSSFMELMERKRRALLVQFWLTIESFKNPLEALDSDSESESSGKGAAELPLDHAAYATGAEDMRMVWDVYFADPAPGAALPVSPKHVAALRQFVETTVGAQEEAVGGARALRRARRAVVKAQGQVYEEMVEDDFDEFKRSELYFKALAEFSGGHNAHTPRLSGFAHSPTAAVRAPPPLPPPPSAAHARAPSGSGDLLSSFTSAAARVLQPVTALRVPLHRAETAPATTSSEPAKPSTALSHSLTLPPPTLFGESDSPEETHTQPMGFLRKPSHLDFLIASRGDAHRTRSPLFSDESTPTSDPTTPTTADVDMRAKPIRLPINGEGADEDEEFVQVQTIDAIQAALSSILASDERRARDRRSMSIDSGEFSLRSGSGVRSAATHTPDPSEDKRRSLADSIESITPPVPHVPVVKVSTNVFGDDEAGGEPEAEGEGEGEGEGEADALPSVQLAAPGDLQLPLEIARLTEKIDTFESQSAILDALARKAELTGNAHELRLLNKSKSTLRREVRQLTFQRSQYELQASENRLLPGRTSVHISSSAIEEAEREPGKQFVRYLIEVHQLAEDGLFSRGWVAARRYSDFFALHTRLKERYTQVRALDFPGKRLVTSLHSHFVETRRIALQNYLQALVAIPIVCESVELRTFLSQQAVGTLPDLSAPSPSSSSLFAGPRLVKNLVRSVAGSLDEVLFGQSMLEVVLSTLSQQVADLAGISGSGVHDEDLISQAINVSGREGELRLPQGLRPLDGGTSYFTEPITDLFIEIFELKEKNNWLRRQAIVIILQQVLGGTVERKLREAIKVLTAPAALMKYINIFGDGLFPNGEMRPPSVPRTPAEKAQTRDDANRKLSTLMPDLAANLIGRSNARRGARRMFSVVQNRRLNKHLIYTLLDTVLDALFPELASSPPASSEP